MKTYVKISLAVVSLLALAGILGALYMYNMKHTDMAKAKPDFVISASSLLKVFEENEADASVKYINKIIEVDGVIQSVKTSDNNIVNISLATESDFSSVIATFTSIGDYTQFKAGDKITLRGECSGFLMDVLLNNCAVIK